MHTYDRKQDYYAEEYYPYGEYYDYGEEYYDYGVEYSQPTRTEKGYYADRPKTTQKRGGGEVDYYQKHSDTRQSYKAAEGDDYKYAPRKPPS